MISLDELVEKYGIKFTGILHIGACDEMGFYDKYIARNNVLWIGAIDEKVELSGHNINFINLDIQGAEKVLKGMEEYCGDKIDYIYTKDTINEIDDYLMNFGFVRKELKKSDAFYVKEKYISANIWGGLGNQLFQIANVYALSFEYNLTPIFKKMESSYSVIKNRPVYFDTIFKKLNVVDEQVYNKINFVKINEGPQNYRKINLESNKSYLLDGYYQSPKYFKKYMPQLKELFALDCMDEIKEYYGRIKRNRNTVSIHVRHGDYLKLSYFHTVLSLDYYRSAVSHFDESSLFVVFSDDIPWCKENFRVLGLKNVYYVEELPVQHCVFSPCSVALATISTIPMDLYELFLMSLCDGHIIANSSFSAWATYLNDNVNKKVVAPYQWFVPHDANNNIKDIYDEGWIIVSQ